MIAQFKEFLLSQANPASYVTVKNYTSDVNRFIKWFENTLGRPFDPTETNTLLIESFKKDSLVEYSASTVDRSLSSLRKFFHFLKIDGQISRSPFEQLTINNQQLTDPWRLKDFKNHLYVFNASHLTIKNYIIDVKQFISWADEVLKDDSWDVSQNGILSKIDSSLVEEYKKRLLEEARLSPISINRKLSSIRRYMKWASEEGLIHQPAEISNLQFPPLRSSSFEGLAISNQLNNEAIEQSSPDQPSTINHQPYSSLPPFRLAQKTKDGLVKIFDDLLIYPVSKALDRSEHAIWNLKGRPVFKQAQSLKLKTQNLKSSIINHKSFDVKNIKKEFYAPALISTKNFSLHRKIWHHARNTRPNWYKRYHSYSFVSYLHFSILMLFISVLGYALFSNLNPQKQPPTLAALPSAPARILSFQGRLTDAQDNPITKQTTLRMGIYNNESASGSALLWQEIVSPTPDSEGIFSVILGKNSAIPQSLFAQNSALWLGVTVEQTSELTPRQQIATVAYAVNAETLQGLPPITNSSSTANVVLALNSSGNLTIGGSASPTFQATGGTFTVSGKVLSLTTTASSNGNIVLNPDGTGTIDLQKPIQNTSNNNSLVPGAVEVDDLFAILGSHATQAVLNVRQNGNGDLIMASTAGATKFRLDNGGNLTASGLINGLTVSSGTITSGTWNATAISATYGGTGINTSSSTGVPFISSGTWSVDPNYLHANHGGTGQTSYSTGDILYASSSAALARLAVGTGSQCLIGGSTPVWGSCTSGTSGAWWSQSNGTLYPDNSTVDFLVGGQSSVSAKFGVLNINSGTPIASISANSGNIATYITGDGTLATTNRGTITIGSSSTYNTSGNILLAPNGTGSVGINTTTPTQALHVAGQCVTGDTLLKRRRRRKGKKSEEEIDLINLIDLISLPAGRQGKQDPSTNDKKEIERLRTKLGIGKLDIGYLLDQLEQLEIRNSVWEDVRIDHIQEGDEILTLDEKTGEFSPQKVENLMDMGVQEVYELLTITGKSIKTTANHPYFVLQEEALEDLFEESNVGQKTGNQDYSKSYSNFHVQLNKFFIFQHSPSIFHDLNYTTYPILNAIVNAIMPKVILATNGHSLNFGTLTLNGIIMAAANQPADKFTNKSDNLLTNTGSIPSILPFIQDAGNWTKVSLLKVGQLIATLGTDGKPQFERILSIKKIGKEQTYDIQVANTHNFVGNNIVAHNTFINSTALTANIKGLEIDQSGAVSGTGYGLHVEKTGASTTNVGGYFSASGATNNYGLIVENGSVGIGTTAPTALLDVAGTASISGALKIYGTTPTIQSVVNKSLVIGGDTTGNITLSPLNSIAGSRVTPGADNLVSLGSSPSARFKDLFLGPSSLHVQCTTGDGCGQGLDYTLGVNTSTGTFSIGVNGTSAVGNTLVNITQGGNVGIGTTSPTGKFQVYDATYGNFSFGGNGDLRFDGGPDYIFWLQNTGASSGRTSFVSAAGTELMTVLNTGNVGIGNTTPLTALDVTGSASLSANLSLRGAATAHTFNILDNGTLNIQRSPGGDAGLATALFVQNNGNVGIGTTAPGAKLEIAASSASLVELARFRNTGSFDGSYLNFVRNSDTTRGLIIGHAIDPTISGNYSFISARGGVSQSIFMSAGLDGSSARGAIVLQENGGAVGIGTTAPTASLHIAGAYGSNAALIVNNLNSGDLFTASASGVTKFTVSNGGAASMSGSLTMIGANSIQTTSNTSLTLGGNTTGNIVLSPLNSIVGSRVTPGADNLVSLGSSPSARFKDLFLGPSSLHVQCTTGDGCGQGLDYTLGVNTSTGTFSIGVNGTSAVGNTLVNITQGGNVGIGTTGPTALLSLGGSAADKKLLVWEDGVAANGAAGFGIQNSEFRMLYPGTGTNHISFGTYVNTTFSEKMRLDQSGNVGIGTTSPLGTLDVRPNLVNGGTISIASISGSTSFAGLLVDNTGLGDLFTASKSGASKFVITNAGNVGIGTTSPAALLQTTGTSTTILTNLILENISTASNLTKGTAIDFYIRDTSVTSKLAARIVSQPDTNVNVNDGILAFYTRTGGLDPAERVRIDNLGNVGISNTSPLAKLDVTGSASLSANLSLRGAATAHTFNILDNGTLNIQRSPGGDAGLATALFVQSNGNVGIGTTNPTVNFAVAGSNSVFGGSSNISTYSAGDSAIEIQASAIGLLGVHGGVSGSNSSSLFIESAPSLGFVAIVSQANGTGIVQPIDFYMGSTQIARFTTGRNLVLGGTTALARLDVRGGSGTTPIASFSGQTSFAGMVIDNSGLGDIFTASSSGLNRFVVKQSGNVGINTTTPLTLMHLVGPSSGGSNPGAILSLSPDNITSPTSTDKFGIQLTADKTGDRVAAIYNTATQTGNAWNQSAMTFWVSGQGIASRELMRIDGQTGNVGIGTTAPGFALDVQNSQAATAAAQIFNTNTGTDADGLILKLGNTSTTAVNTANHFISFETAGIGIVGSIQGNGGKNVAYVTNGIADLAEHMKKDPNQNIEWGAILCQNSSGNVEPCSSDSSSIVGVASEFPTFVGGEDKGEASITVGLVGIVSTRVSSGSGAIRSGDYIAMSDTPGVGVKAINAGQVVGVALEDYTSSQAGRILVRVGPSWFDPNVYLTDAGVLNLGPTVDGDFEVKRNTGEAVARIGAFSELVVAKIKAGYLEVGRITVKLLNVTSVYASEITTNSLAVATDNFSIAGQGIRDYIYSIVDQRISNQQLAISNQPSVKADIISPLSGKNLTVKLPAHDSSFIIRNSSDSAVASIDSHGNATLSGKLKAKSIETDEASISGTLTVGRIIASQIDLSDEALAKLEERFSSNSANITNNYYSTPSATSNQQLATSGYGLEASGSALLSNLPVGEAGLTIEQLTVNQGLMSFGPTTFFEASVADRLFIGSQLSLADNSINVLGGNLELQPLKQGGVAFVGGQVEIDTDGNLKVNGNGYFAKDINVAGKLFANIIAPIPGKDIVFELPESSGSETYNSEFIIHNSSQSGVLSINSRGDLSASGAGTFSKLNLNIANVALAISDTEVIATGSAGTAQIQTNKTELTIKNPLVTQDSLIYVTPKTSTPNQSVYLLRQVPGVSFTVGISQALNKKIPFNWIIIN